MNPRDFLTTAAIGLVLVVGGLAIADSVRGCNERDVEATPAQTTVPTTTGANGPAPQADAPEGWPEGELDGVMTFVDADTCIVRSIGLSGGRERPLTENQSNCQGFWAPPISARIAYAIGTPGRRGFLFQIADLGQGDRDFGNYGAIAAPVWSADGQRVAWCDSPDTGVEREILGDVRGLSFCPLAYTPEGSLVHAEGRQLVLGTTPLVSAPEPITWAQFAHNGNGSFVVLAGRRLERFVNGAPGTLFDLPGEWGGRPPRLSPDTCQAAVQLPTGVRVMPLCDSGEVTEVPGQAPAWSPDGEWLATAYSDAIVFHRMDGGGETINWPAAAAQLAWRAD